MKVLIISALFLLFSSCVKYHSNYGKAIGKFHQPEKDSAFVMPVINGLSQEMKSFPSPESWNLILNTDGRTDTVSVKREIFEKVKVGDDVIIYSKIK